MAACFQISAQLAVVVDFAVEDHGDTPIFVESRLLPGEQIDNRQTTHAQSDAIIQEIALRVRTAMNHPVAHQAQEFLATFRRRRARIKIGPTGYATHKIDDW